MNFPSELPQIDLVIVIDDNPTYTNQTSKNNLNI